MKNLIVSGLFVTLLSIHSAQASEVTSWSCSSQVRMSGETGVRLAKTGDGYSVYITAHSGDVGEQWSIKDELIAEGLSCEFSKKFDQPLYCSTDKEGWLTVRASNETIDAIDQETGADESHFFTEVIVSGNTSPVMAKFKNSVLRFGAKNCTRN